MFKYLGLHDRVSAVVSEQPPTEDPWYPAVPPRSEFYGLLLHSLIDLGQHVPIFNTGSRIYVWRTTFA